MARLGPEAWPDPPDLKPLLDAKRPLHSLLRDQQVVTGIGRTWVDEILHTARLSPFKRGDDLSDEEAEALRGAMVSELVQMHCHSPGVHKRRFVFFPYRLRSNMPRRTG